MIRNYDGSDIMGTWMQSGLRGLVALSILAAIAACSPVDQDSHEGSSRAPDRSYLLETVGAMHATVMGGERDAKIQLTTLAGKPHLYAVGPMAGLTGEITIMGGRPLLATVGSDGKVVTETSFEAGAPFLVWAEVSGWHEEPLPASVHSVADLEEHLMQRAAERGLTEAFPFTLAGRADNVGFHVLKADPGAPHPAGMDAHKEIQVHFDSGPAEVKLIGFYSTTHQGVFVHQGSFTHIHFQTADNSQSGHVETIDFGSGSFVLALPR